MTSKAAEKIIEALTQLMEGYCELQEAVENDYGATDSTTEEGDELNAEADAALVTEMRAAIESVLESEDYTPDEFGSIISTLTDALEEIDPDVFEKEIEEDDEDYEDDDDAEEYEDEDYEEEDETPAGKKRRSDEDEDEEEEEEEEESGKKPSRRR